ncbi:uncharacterized protein BJX67DRAFT_333816 [Aspergillus lucknowensis]|uniref:Zn(2)-C6 fungal-type domain-containing protein n=1 Tax=Aspergillus lucknowensis TaxID=176173 RepID=A0ABR4LYL2_9EURO
MAEVCTGRAANVCVNCKVRKKKCDKALPSCSYCNRKGRRCHYQSPRPVFHDRNAVGRDAFLPQRGAFRLANASHTNPIIGSTLLLVDVLPLGSLAPTLLNETTIEDTLYAQAQRILGATGQYFDEISVHYFRTKHSFVPILSRRHFHNSLVSFATSRADFAILLLSMCLFSYRPSPDRSIDIGTLYLSVRSLFLHAQALCKSSLRLVQAGVLLAFYEYSNGKPEQALITIGGCVRMAHAAGLKYPSSLPKGSSTENDEQMGQIDDEQTNTWWVILIYERIFLCETPVVDQRVVSVMPEDGSYLATSTGPPQQPFHQAARAAWLLYEVRRALLGSDWSMHFEKLDKELQLFLAGMVKEPLGASSAPCWPVSIVIRALFLLHGHILDHTRCSELSRKSQTALDTVTRMVLDIVDMQMQLPADQLETHPPSCVYMVRAAQKHLRKGAARTLDEQRDANLRLQTVLNRFAPGDRGTGWGA